MTSVYGKVPITSPVADRSGEYYMRGAEATAAGYQSMGQGLGQAVNKISSWYFDKKDTDAQVEHLSNDPEVLKLVFKGREIPEDPEERKKVIKVFHKELGGLEGIYNFQMRDRAEKLAQSAEQRGIDALQLQQKKFDQGTEAIKRDLKKERNRNEILEYAFTKGRSTERVEGSIGGGTVGEMFPGLRPKERAEIELQTPIRTGLGFKDLIKEVDQPTPQVAQPEPSYMSRMMGGLREVGETAREKLAGVEIPEVPLAMDVTTETPMPFEERTMEGFVESMQQGGFPSEYMPYILELSKGKPSRSQLGAHGIVDALRDRTFFSPQDAVNAYNDQARRLDYIPKQAGRDAFIKTARIVDPEDIKKAVATDFKMLELETPYEVFQSLSTTQDLLKSAVENPIAGPAAIRQVARMFEPSGPLAEDDIKPFAGSQALIDQWNAVFEKAKKGTIPTTDIAHLQEIVDVVANSARDKLSEGIPTIISKVAKSFKVTEEEVKGFTYLTEMTPKEEIETPDEVVDRILEQPIGSTIDLPGHGKVTLMAIIDGVPMVMLENGQWARLPKDNPTPQPPPQPPPQNLRIPNPRIDTSGPYEERLQGAPLGSGMP